MGIETLALLGLAPRGGFSDCGFAMCQMQTKGGMFGVVSGIKRTHSRVLMCDFFFGRLLSQ